MLYKAESPNSIKNTRDVEGHITRINRAVQNVFSSLDPEDNFSAEELQRYQETKHFASMLEVRGNGLRTVYTDLVNKSKTAYEQQMEQIRLALSMGDITYTITFSEEAISIEGERLDISTQNFVLTDTQAVAKGEIHAKGGEIAGWRIKTSGNHTSWAGGSNSKIEARFIVADYGEGRTINAYGNVNINATFKGNFEDINVSGAKFLGGFSCSAMESSKRLTCGSMRIYTTQRAYGEAIPSSPKRPSKDELEEDNDEKYPNRYNTNDNPEGGLVVSGNIQCQKVRSSTANTTWSDIRLKENIRGIETEESSLLLGNISPKSFTFKGSGNRSTGFIAQEVDKRFTKEMQGGILALDVDSITCCLDKILHNMGERYG
nr:MAG TPA: endosialidase chaperone [Caudoviricetes sp.]